MVRKDKEEVRSSSVSICCGRPSAVPVGRKTSPNKGIHPAYPGYRSETPSQKIFFPTTLPLHSITYSICMGNDPPPLKVRRHFFYIHQLARPRPAVHLYNTCVGLISIDSLSDTCL